jgi:uncharacterized protein (TIGR02231 family)
MKKLILTTLILLLAVICTFADTEKEIKAAISKVTVYPDRAQLVRDATFDVPAGKTILKLQNLSPYIDAQSIQVKGLGGFTILSVNLQNNYLQNLEDTEEVKNLRNQIEALQFKTEDEKALLNTLDEKLAFLTANRSVLLNETTFSLDQFKALMDLYTSSIEQTNLAKLKKARLVKDYEKRIAALQQQISGKTGTAKVPSGEISVTVSTDKPVKGRMTFSYLVSNAGWFSSYDIRVEDINRPVSVNYKANVYQTTGVEWKNVKLSFSNATPWVAGNVPVLNPWFIDFFHPVQVAAYGRAAPSQKSRAPAMPEGAVSVKSSDIAAEPEAAMVSVEKKVGEMSVTFDVALPYTIQPDGKIQTIEIQETSSQAEYKYVTVPKISPLAYLTGSITDWTKQSLLSGEATLYFENTFVGKSYLDVNQLSDTLSLSLGTDNGILVRREKRREYTSTRIIGANKTEIYSFLITIRNNKGNPVRIVVNDQIPVSSNSSITVEAEELSGGRLDTVTGSVKWDLEVKSQETRELILTYSVKYPKNLNIILE